MDVHRAHPAGHRGLLDVHRASYTLVGTRLVVSGRSVVAREAPDPTLPMDGRQMYDPEGLLSDC